jgi:hypothetical protein
MKLNMNIDPMNRKTVAGITNSKLDVADSIKHTTENSNKINPNMCSDFILTPSSFLQDNVSYESYS